MAQITFQGMPATTQGNLPKIGETAPDFVLVSNDLSEKSLSDYKGSRIVLNIFPSIDTGTCATSVRKFNQNMAKLTNTKVLCISKDLPFAQSRFCGAEGITNVETLSDFRNDFGKNYPIAFIDTPLKGLFSRSIIVIDQDGKVIYTEQVSETTSEPNYDAVYEVLR